MAIGDGVPSPQRILEITFGRDVVEYHNGTDYLSILGEALSCNRRRKLTRIVVDDKVMDMEAIVPSPNLENARDELSGLDASDREYLLKKGVFTMPPETCT